MGMRDESWCNGCGTSVAYSDEEENYCGDCSEEYTKAELLSFVVRRIAELTQLRENFEAQGDHEMDDYSAGAIDAYDIVRMKLTDKIK